ASAVKGKSVYYYLEADNAQGDSIARQGDSGSPFIVTVNGGDDENPLGDGGGGGGSGGGGDTGTEGNLTGNAAPPGNPHVLIVVAVGTGGGIVSGVTEVTNSKIQGLFAPSLFHIAPEVSFY